MIPSWSRYVRGSSTTHPYDRLTSFFYRCQSIFCLPSLDIDAGRHLEDRHEDGQDDDQHDAPHEHDGDRLEEPRHAGDEGLHPFLVVARHPPHPQIGRAAWGERGEIS